MTYRVSLPGGLRGGSEATSPARPSLGGRAKPRLATTAAPATTRTAAHRDC